MKISKQEMQLLKWSLNARIDELERDKKTIFRLGKAIQLEAVTDACIRQIKNLIIETVELKKRFEKEPVSNECKNRNSKTHT